MNTRVIRSILLILIIVSIGPFAACFSADEEPEEPSTGDDDDADDDSDDAADDAGDDTDDDLDDDTDDDDDADDDSDDDTDDDTSTEVDCEAVAVFVYDGCEDAFAQKSGGDRLTRVEALDACTDGGDFWICVQNCLTEAEALTEGQCSAMIDCVNDECTEGTLVLVDVP